MKLCVSCGQQINDDAQVCPFCGAPQVTARQAQPQQINQPIAQGQMNQPSWGYGYQQGMPMGYGYQNPDAIRQKSIVDMNNLINYFSQKQQQYNEYDSVTESISQLLGRHRKPVPLLVWGIIITVLSSVFLLSFKDVKDMPGFKIFLIVSVIIGLGMIAGFILLSIRASNYNKNKLKSDVERQAELSEELANHYYAYGYCPVGMEFTNPTILRTIADNIRQGRADTPKEALNNLLDDAHRAQMELLSQQTLAAAKLTAANSSVIAANSAITAAASVSTAVSAAQAAKAARTGAVFAAANFFFR